MAGYVASTEERVVATAQGNTAQRKGAPVRPSAAITVQGWGPVQRDGGWAYNRGLRFTVPPSRPDADVLAVANGALTFVPAAGGEPAGLLLRLSGLDEMALRAAGMPAWIPALDGLLYHGVDPVAVRAAVTAMLADPGRLAAANSGYRRISGATADASAAQLAQVFVEHPEQLGDGLPVRTGEVLGAAAGGVFELRVATPGVSDLSRNPAWYLYSWETAGLLDLRSHPLRAALLRLDQGVLGSGVVHYVARTGDDTHAPFTDPGQPARTVSAALAAAGAGGTVLILDDGTYAEAEIVVTEAVNLTSAAALGADQRHLGGDPGDTAAPDVPAGLPVLQGNGPFAGIRDDLTGDAAVFPAAQTHRVLRFTVPAGAGIASVTKVVIRHGGAREGGGMLIVDSGPVVVASCRLHRNVAYFNALFFSANHGGFPHPYRGSGWSQEGFGGAICAYASSPMIVGNRIDRNLALNGGGIGLFARCFPLIASNYLARNALPDWFGAGTPGDGGGIRVLSLNLRSQTLAMSDLDPSTTADKARLLTAFLDLFGPTIEAAEMYDPAHVTECRRGWIHLHRNRVLDNRAGDDGGGVYATGVSRLMSTGNVVTGNVAARGDGGGFRISTASVLRSRHDVVAGNRVDGAPSAGATGGGIAVRCSDLYLLGARVEGNRSHFAGAGISFTANREAGVTGVDWLPALLPTWDEQRRAVFGYTHAHLQIDETTRVLANTADDPVRGKGGGLYLFRMADGDFFGDQVTAVIAAPDAVLDTGNDGAFAAGGVHPYRRLYLLDQTENGPGGAPPLILADADVATAPAVLSYVSLRTS